MNKQVLKDFTDKIFEFIKFNELEDKDCGLIMDYVESLQKKGVDLQERDFEKEIYIFYNYHKKFNNILTNLGEESFIDAITAAEILKIKLTA